MEIIRICQRCHHPAAKHGHALHPTDCEETGCECDEYEKCPPAARPPSELDVFRALLARAGIAKTGGYLSDDGFSYAGLVEVTVDGTLYFDHKTGALLTGEEADRRRQADDE